MAKTKVEVLNTIVDGARRGETIAIDSRSAEHLERIGYVKILGEETAAQEAKVKAEEQVEEKPKKKKG
ncbi:hypothetical protein [Sporosarcina sp. FSL K6-3508]|uniref:hypothetical protein n=1 Tax=Sporosarcina sp. FSL K6-3508 TaxID=2921557 RepID=UPI003159DE3A